MDVSSGLSTIKGRRSLPLLNLATVGVVVAWLAVACYAFAYLISH